VEFKVNYNFLWGTPSIIGATILSPLYPLITMESLWSCVARSTGVPIEEKHL
tara:strand:+ start:2866 stop:3021 length:156 start_codon:yes stop_codon:yes gene_type:complete